MMNTISSLAARLARLNKQLSKDEQQQIKVKTGGIELTHIIGSLFNAIDADMVEAKALEIAGQPIGTDPGDINRAKAKEQLVAQSANIFTGELIELIDSIRRDHEQSIDHENMDVVLRAEWDKDAANNSQTLVDEFAEYLVQQQDNITALTIFFNQPYRRRELSFGMIHQVLDKLKADKPKLAPARIWQAYSQLDDYKGEQPVSELAALVALIRRVCDLDATLAPFDATVRRNFQTWIMQLHSGDSQKFNEAQMQWLRMVRDHVASSFHIERDDLDMAPFDAQGGLGKMYQLFGQEMDSLLNELNEVLVA